MYSRIKGKFWYVLQYPSPELVGNSHIMFTALAHNDSSRDSFFFSPITSQISSPLILLEAHWHVYRPQFPVQEDERRLGSTNDHMAARSKSKMASGGNFREVLHHSGKPQGNVINFTIGSATTVRDEENAQPHTGGGFAYRECGTVDSVTRNRYIFWFVVTRKFVFETCNSRQFLSCTFVVKFLGLIPVHVDFN